MYTCKAITASDRKSASGKRIWRMQSISRRSMVQTALCETRYAGHCAIDVCAPLAVVRLGRSCRRMRLSSWLWQVAQEKSSGPERRKKISSPMRYICASLGCAAGTSILWPFDLVATNVTSASMSDSRLCQPSVACGEAQALQRGHAGDQPRLRVLHLAGVREVARQLRERALELARTEPEVALLQGRVLRAARRVHSSSPFSSSSSAGLPSWSISRYCWICSMALLSCAVALSASATPRPAATTGSQRWI